MSFIKKDLSPDQVKEMVYSLETQLIDLYDEQARYGRPSELHASLKSLEEQLMDFYALQEKYGSFDDIHTSLKGLEEQLASFYHDVEHHDGQNSEVADLKEAVGSLERQIISLIDEKAEMEEKVKDVQSRFRAIKEKSRDLGAAVFEAALFEHKKSA